MLDLYIDIHNIIFLHLYLYTPINVKETRFSILKFVISNNLITKCVKLYTIVYPRRERAIFAHVY